MRLFARALALSAVFGCTPTSSTNKSVPPAMDGRAGALTGTDPGSQPPTASGSPAALSGAAPPASNSGTAATGGPAAGNLPIPADRLVPWKPGLTYNGGIPERHKAC